jgi:hypothetical protein
MGFLGSLFRRKASFQRLVEQALAALGDGRAVSWLDHDEGLEAVVLDQWPNVGTPVELGAAWSQWKRDGTFDQASLASVARPGASTRPGFATKLLSVDEVSKLQQVDAGPVAREVVPGALGLLLWFDSPRVTIASLERCAAVGVSIDEGWRQALAAPQRFEEAEPRLFLVDPSLALVDPSAAHAPMVFGDPLLVVLDEHTAWFTGTREVEALARLTMHVRAHVAARSPTLGHSLAFVGGRWEQWLPPRELEAARMFFVMLRRCALRDAYAAQKRELDVGDVFVASYLADAKGGLVPMSLGSWGKGVVSLLPRTDVLAIGRSLTDQKLVRFEDAQRLLGHYLQALPDVWPPRWLVERSPTDEEFGALPALGGEPDLGAWFEDERDPGPLNVPTPHVGSKSAFVAEAIAVLRALGVANPEYSEEGFGVRFEGPPPPGMVAPEGSTFLRQVGFRTPYDRYHHLPDDERRTRLVAHFAGVLGGLAGAASTDVTVLPVLRPSSMRWRSALQLVLQFQQQDPKLEVVLPELVSRPLCPGLSLDFVMDTPTTVNFLDRNALQRLGLSEDGLFERAMETLAKRTSGALAAVRPGLYRSTWQDDYDASRIMLPSVLEGLSLKGQPVAFVPDRSTLIVTGSEDAPNLLEAFALVRLAQKGGARPVTLEPLLLTSEGWTPWLPDQSSSARAPLLELAGEQRATDLGDQAELLAARWPQRQVAQLDLRHASGRFQVHATVPTEGAVLLPRVDFVVEREGAAADWASFAHANASALSAVPETSGEWFSLRAQG